MNDESQVAEAVKNAPPGGVPIIEAKKKVAMQNDELQFLYGILMKVNPQDINNARIVWDLFQIIEDLVVEFEKNANKLREIAKEVQKEFADSNTPEHMKQKAEGEKKEEEPKKKMTQAEMDEKIDNLNVEIRALHAEKVEFEMKTDMITVLLQMIDKIVASPGIDMAGRNNVRMLVGAHDALQKARISG